MPWLPLPLDLCTAVTLSVKIFLIIIYNIATSNLVLVFFTALIAVHSTYLLVYMFIIYLLAL